VARDDDTYRRRGGAGEAPRVGAPRDPFWWLRNRDALLRRFVVAQAVGAPRCREPLFRRRRPFGGR